MSTEKETLQASQGEYQMTDLPTHLCVGGRLDGQHRTMPHDVWSFGAIMGAAEYRLDWSIQHGRFVWWCKQ